MQAMLDAGRTSEALHRQVAERADTARRRVGKRLLLLLREFDQTLHVGDRDGRGVDHQDEWADGCDGERRQPVHLVARGP